MSDPVQRELGVKVAEERSSYTNLQVLSSDSAAVRVAIDVCGLGSSKMLARADVKWIGVYSFLTEGDSDYLKQSAQQVSKRLETAVFGFMVTGGEMLKYFLFDNDRLVDEYCSNPGYPHYSEHATGGDVAKILPYFRPGTKASELKRILHPPSFPATDEERQIAADKLVQKLAPLLAIPRAQLCTGYNYLKWAQAGR